MIVEKIKKVLVLAPHTDDGEFGCGGTIAKLINQGVEVHYIAFSACEKSVLKEFPSDILVTEVKKATSVLGIDPLNIHVLKYEVRTFNFNRQLILDDLIKYRKTISPDLVFIPSVNDIHQDHATIAIEAVRAFKFVNIFSYELPWNNFNFGNTHFSVLEEVFVQKKVDAIKQYKSQSHRSYAKENFIRSLLHVRGVQIGQQYAEVFEIVRSIS